MFLCAGQISVFSENVYQKQAHRSAAERNNNFTVCPHAAVSCCGGLHLPWLCAGTGSCCCLWLHLQPDKTHQRDEQVKAWTGSRWTLTAAAQLLPLWSQRDRGANCWLALPEFMSLTSKVKFSSSAELQHKLSKIYQPVTWRLCAMNNTER